MMCDEKANNVKYIEPVVTNQAESGQVHLITPPVMLEESLGQEDLPESQENLHLLKYLVCKETGITFSFSIMLPGREMSRLHSRVFVREEKVIMETVV